MKQTAVEWLNEQLQEMDSKSFNNIIQIEMGRDNYNHIIEEAKAMEKEQIMNAWYNGFEENRPYVDHSEDYYNKTYKQNDNEK